MPAMPALGNLTAGVTMDSVANNLSGQDLMGQAAGIQNAVASGNAQDAVLQTTALSADALNGSQAGNLMTVANTNTPGLTNAMATGDLATELNTGLHVLGDAAGAVGNDSAATGLHSAADSSVNSIDAYNQGDVVSSIGHGTTAVVQGTGNAGTTSTDGTSANAAESNVSGTETATGADGLEH